MCKTVKTLLEHIYLENSKVKIIVSDHGAELHLVTGRKEYELSFLRRSYYT